MSAGSLIARKSIRARWGRTLAIAFAITASVSFVVGSFVLADSLRVRRPGTSLTSIAPTIRARFKSSFTFM
jgi:hypothetical protein